MAYTTVARVREALEPDTPLGDQPADDTAASLSDAQLADAIAEADARIDSYLAARYTLPVPADAVLTLEAIAPVRFWSRNIAAYLASLTLYRSALMEPTNPVYLRMQDTMRDMVAARDGKLLLPIPVETAPDDDQAGFAVVENGPGMQIFDAYDVGVPRTWGGRGVGFPWQGGYVGW